MDKKKIAKTSLIAVSAVAIAGLAFTAPSIAATAKHPTIASANFQGKGHGDHGFGKGNNHGGQPGFGAEVSKDVTVTVPDDGATYELLVTESAPPAATNSNTSNPQARGFEKHSFVVAVTGTGNVTVSVPGLHPGSYKVDLLRSARAKT